MSNTRKTDALRALMAERAIDIYIIPTADFHESEYVGDHFKARKFMTGFTGSAGIAVVTKDHAGLWTDGRYFIQAERELEGSGFSLFRMGEKNVPTVNAFVEEMLPEGGTVGFDGRVVNASWGRKLREIAEKKHGKLSCTEDLVGRIWEDRPALSLSRAWILGEAYAGAPASEKLRRVREAVREKGADLYLLTSLDDIAWLLNLRGDDAAHFPILLSYLLMAADACTLYVQEGALTEEVRAYLAENGVDTKPYSAVYEDADALGAESGHTVLLDLSRVNYRLYEALSAGCEVVNAPNPTQRMKCVKNAVEAENIRKAHVQDGIAMVKWLYWLDGVIGKEPHTEVTVSDRLEAVRRARPHFLDLSFGTISAYGANAAMMHYSASPASCAVLKLEGLLLVDSGGHYLEGTTDITRTIALGPITEEERRFFTIVLQCNLNLAGAHFPEGVNGQNLDVLARGPLWNLGLDYRCGTGHGVGYVLNVHEGPNGFRWKIVPERQDSAPFEPGMVTTDEPGIYEEGRFGIRIENELLCVPDRETEYGRYLKFETVTYCPIDLDAVDVSMLTAREKALLNEYHRTVYETLAPHLTEEEAAWLAHETREV